MRPLAASEDWFSPSELTDGLQDSSNEDVFQDAQEEQGAIPCTSHRRSWSQGWPPDAPLAFTDSGLAADTSSQPDEAPGTSAGSSQHGKLAGKSALQLYEEQERALRSDSSIGTSVAATEPPTANGGLHRRDVSLQSTEDGASTLTGPPSTLTGHSTHGSSPSAVAATSFGSRGSSYPAHRHAAPAGKR